MSEHGQHPRVFVSHASEDKQRFVLDLVEKLRLSGIDAWIDLWEMLPGDSIVDKIFEEGIGKANGVIVVLSKFSADKPWVKEELNAAVVKRINQGSLLIPVVLDGVTVPEALRSTVWETIGDTSDYSDSLERIVSAVLGNRHKPKLGAPPRYSVGDLPQIPSLTELDILTLREFGAIALATDSVLSVGTGKVWKRLEALDVPRQDFLDSTSVLCDHRYLTRSAEVSVVPRDFSFTQLGFERYLSNFYPDYPGIFDGVASAILNEHARSLPDLLERYRVPSEVVRHILRVMQNRRLVRICEGIGGVVVVDKVLPGLRRYLQ